MPTMHPFTNLIIYFPGKINIQRNHPKQIKLLLTKIANLRNKLKEPKKSSKSSTKDVKNQTFLESTEIFYWSHTNFSHYAIGTAL